MAKHVGLVTFKSPSYTEVSQGIEIKRKRRQTVPNYLLETIKSYEKKAATDERERAKDHITSVEGKEYVSQSDASRYMKEIFAISTGVRKNLQEKILE